MKDFFQTTLAQAPDYFDETISLIEKGFKYPTHHSFLTDFYPLLGPLNHHNCHLLIDNKKVIGHIAVKERTLHYKGIETPVALIGGIVIDERNQQQGNFTPFFKNIQERYKDDNSLFLLWSDLKSLYNRFEFYEAGGVIQTGTKKLLNENLSSDWKQTTFKSLSPEDFDQVKDLYANQNNLTLKRSESDWDQIKEITSSNLYIKKSDVINSYFIKGKGNDLTNIIHEFITSHDPIDQYELFSDYQLWLPEKYNKVFNKKDIFYSSFMKIANPILLSNFLRELTNDQLSINSFMKNEINISYLNNSFDFKVDEFLTGIFGPTPIKEFEQIIPGIYIGGVDSI
ncbi:GNAT family N-acetyltransferase [Halobacteriovorax marinus]|uniref:GNAT family N-acetyltransferase n=1 Tax=Halobacteriovorax marinus TaxID=97084 RepID=UPI003A92F0B7